MLSLRTYQQEWVNGILTARRNGCRRMLLSGATGTGKGVLFSAAYKELGIAPKRLLVLVHLENLAKQAYDKAKQWNPDVSVGLEMADSFAGGASIVIGSVPTLGRKSSTRLEQFNPEEFAALIWDEAHTLPCPSGYKILSHFGLNPERFGMERAGTPPIRTEYTGRGPVLIGLTATPYRTDNKSLTQYFDQQVANYPVETAIKDGWLSDLVGVKVKTNVNLSKIKVRAGDLDPAMVEAAVNIKVRNKLVVSSWLQHAKDKPTVIFCSSIAHAKSQALEFQAAGVAIHPIWGTDPYRDEKLAALETGQIVGLTTCSMLGIGWDFPPLQCICMASPTQSQLKYVQQCGRGTRLHPNKTNCLILDFVDNSTKHTLVTLPLVFGLSQKLDLAGQSVTESLNKVKAIKEKHPNIDLSKIEVITELESYIERVDLFRGAQIAQQYSVPSWVRSNPRNVIRFNVAKIYAKNVLSAAELNCLTEGQVNAILNTKLQQLREELKVRI